MLALKGMHDEAAVDEFTQRRSVRRTIRSLRRELFTTLIRLYHREADYTGGWWGTRPDTTGPYYDRQPWAGTRKDRGHHPRGRDRFRQGDRSTYPRAARQARRQNRRASRCRPHRRGDEARAGSGHHHSQSR